MPTAYNPISLEQVQTEFTGTNPIGINEYYRGGGYTTQNNTNVPTSGTISLADFYSAYRQVISTGGHLHVFNDDVNNTGKAVYFPEVGRDVNPNEDVLVQPSGPATFGIFNRTSEGGNASNRADNQINAEGKWFLTIPLGDSVIGTIEEMINEGNKYYTVTWNTPFPSDQYQLTITIDTNMSASGINVNTSAVAGIRKRANGFDVGFCAKESVVIAGIAVYSTGYVRQFSAVAVY